MILKHAIVNFHEVQFCQATIVVLEVGSILWMVVDVRQYCIAIIVVERQFIPSRVSFHSFRIEDH